MANFPTLNDQADVTVLIQAIKDAIAEVGVTTTLVGVSVPFPSGTGGYSLPVTFDTPFHTTPSVVVTSGSLSLESPRVFNKTETGFTIRFDRASSGNYTFDWIATVPS